MTEGVGADSVPSVDVVPATIHKMGSKTKQQRMRVS
jgi:hypothetical protein